MTFKVLIADGAPNVANMVAGSVRATWPSCEVKIVADGLEALRYFAEEGADLVVLDLAMPPPDGCEVCRRIRETSRVPILMLAGRDDVADKVRALESGADDCLTKPYSRLEFGARLRALLRRVTVHGE